MIAIGDKVICIVNEWKQQSNHCPNGYPIKNKIYCVDGFYVDYRGVLGLLIVGLPTIHLPTNTNVGFHACGFRKLEDAKMENELNYYKSKVFDQ